MNIVIIKYNAGNIRSVEYALHRLGYKAIITDDPDQIKAADKVIFPGVGQAGTAMQYLKERELDKLIPSLTQPVLGICLGMQLLCTYSEENNTKGLEVFNTCVKRFTGKAKIPHTGWNKVISSPILPKLCTSQKSEVRNLFHPEHGRGTGCRSVFYHAYFVHSFYAEICHESTAITEYTLQFSACLHKNNFYGVQFHPEKSAAAGEQLLKNFLDL